MFEKLQDDVRFALVLGEYLLKLPYELIKDEIAFRRIGKAALHEPEQ